MRNSTPVIHIAVLALALGLAAPAGPAHAAAAKRKAGLSKGAGLTPSQRAGIPPEAFGSPVPSPDKSQVAWIADIGDGPNLFVGPPDRKHRVALTHYLFKPADDLMPGLPILWSPDGKRVTFYEYSHSGASPGTSSHAVVVAADAAGDPLRIDGPRGNFNTRPVQWLSATALRLKGLSAAGVNSPEEPFVYDFERGASMLEPDWKAAVAVAKAAADSARAAADSARAAQAGGKDGGKKKK